LSDIYSSTESIKIKHDVVNNEKVARFSYTNTAYLNDDAVGVSVFSTQAEQNVPRSELTDLNETVLDKGVRSQASSIPRNMLNHFFGRMSYNLNKLNDWFNVFLANYLRTLARDGFRYSPTTRYRTGDWCTFFDTSSFDSITGTFGVLRFFIRISSEPLELSNIPPISLMLVNTTHWSEFTSQRIRGVIPTTPGLELLTLPNLSWLLPSMNGFASSGNSTIPSREDHVHPTDTSRVPTTRTVTANTGLSGGGNLSNNITLSVNLNYFYPVGSVFLQVATSTSNVFDTAFPVAQRPATRFGGTWSKLGATEGIFLRTEGGLSDVSRTNGLQNSAFQGHSHTISVSGSSGNLLSYDNNLAYFARGNTNLTRVHSSSSPVHDGVHSSPLICIETRPVNRLMVLWIRNS